MTKILIATILLLISCIEFTAITEDDNIATKCIIAVYSKV